MYKKNDRREIKRNETLSVRTCTQCIHVHHHSDDWVGPMAFGTIMGTGIGLVASAASQSHKPSSTRILIDDLEEQNAILKARVNALKEKCADLRVENDSLREENEALRRKIKKMKCCSSELMIKVDACG